MIFIYPLPSFIAFSSLFFDALKRMRVPPCLCSFLKAPR
jgi:hypothetical protein